MMNTTCAINSCSDNPFRAGVCKTHFTSIINEAHGDDQSAVAREQPKKPPAFQSALFVFNRIADKLVEGYRKTFELKQEDLLKIHLDEARGHMRSGESSRASAALTAAGKLAPEDPSIKFSLGMLHLGEGRYPEALSCFREVEQAAPDHAKLRLRIGEALSGLARYDEAVGYLERAVADDPDNAECHHRLGLVCEVTAAYERAADCFANAAQRDPAEPRYLQALGFAYETLGRHEEALVCFKRAAALEN